MASRKYKIRRYRSSMGRRRYNECLCHYCCRSGSGWRRFVKSHTVRIDRVEGKEQIAEQLNDHLFGIDPD